MIEGHHIPLTNSRPTSTAVLEGFEAVWTEAFYQPI